MNIQLDIFKNTKDWPAVFKKIDGGVTVHHACHARAQNMGVKARDMLKLIPNAKIDVVERCGGSWRNFLE